MLARVWITGVVCFFLVACHGTEQVETAYGIVEGKRYSDITAYLGIPYAQPPVGELRWSPPLIPKPWQGVLKAYEPGPACTQYGSGLPLFRESEDCLMLNIWVPNTPGPHPVMFWIHGGAQMAGSAGELQYDGGDLAVAQNVVVVSANYRLLVSGFFALPALENSPELTGNQAIQDLIAALDWVHTEIAAFGGDPGNVTLFGESAGSTNTCALLASRKTREPEQLFHKAIMQSGACNTMPLLSLQQAQEQGLEVLRALGCDQHQDPLACARRISIDVLRDHYRMPLFQSFSYRLDEWSYRAGLVIDGDILPEDPLNTFASGEVADIPLLLGTNKNEGSLFAAYLDYPDTAESYYGFLQARYTGRGGELQALYPFHKYPDAGEAHADILGDYKFKCPALAMAKIYSQFNPVWMYSFEHDVRSPFFSLLRLGFGRNAPELGTFHSSEIGYIFEFPLLSLLDRRSDQRVRELFQHAWGSFARFGDPEVMGASTLGWEPFDGTRDNYLLISDRPENRNGFREGYCDYWLSEGTVPY